MFFHFSLIVISIGCMRIYHCKYILKKLYWRKKFSFLLTMFNKIGLAACMFILTSSGRFLLSTKVCDLLAQVDQKCKSLLSQWAQKIFCLLLFLFLFHSIILQYSQHFVCCTTQNIARLVTQSFLDETQKNLGS